MASPQSKLSWKGNSKSWTIVSIGSGTTWSSVDPGQYVANRASRKISKAFFLSCSSCHSIAASVDCCSQRCAWVWPVSRALKPRQLGNQGDILSHLSTSNYSWRKWCCFHLACVRYEMFRAVAFVRASALLKDAIAVSPWNCWHHLAWVIWNNNDGHSWCTVL